MLTTCLGLALFLVAALAFLFKYFYMVQNKCEKYWPSPGDTLHLQNLTVASSHEQIIGDVIKRCLIIKDVKTNVSMKNNF